MPSRSLTKWRCPSHHMGWREAPLKSAVRGGGVWIALGEGPEVLHGAAAVALGLAALFGEAGEEEAFAGGFEGALAGLGEGQEPACAGGGIDGEQLGGGQAGVGRGLVEDLALGRPGFDAGGGAVEGEAGGSAAPERHDIDLGGALVGGGEGQLFAVRGDGRVGLGTRLRAA